MADSDSHPALRGDEAELFQAYNDELLRTLSRSVRVSTPQTIEDALSIIERLPPRLRRIAMLRGMGVRPKEIGEITGDSRVRVSQLIARANAEVYEIRAERAHHV